MVLVVPKTEGLEGLLVELDNLGFSILGGRRLGRWRRGAEGDLPVDLTDPGLRVFHADGKAGLPLIPTQPGHPESFKPCCFRSFTATLALVYR